MQARKGPPTGLHSAVSVALWLSADTVLQVRTGVTPGQLSATRPAPNLNATDSRSPPALTCPAAASWVDWAAASNWLAATPPPFLTERPQGQVKLQPSDTDAVTSRLPGWNPELQGPPQAWQNLSASACLSGSPAPTPAFLCPRIWQARARLRAPVGLPPPRPRSPHGGAEHREVFKRLRNTSVETCGH